MFFLVSSFGYEFTQEFNAHEDARQYAHAMTALTRVAHKVEAITPSDTFEYAVEVVAEFAIAA